MLPWRSGVGKAGWISIVTAWLRLHYSLLFPESCEDVLPSFPEEPASTTFESPGRVLYQTRSMIRSKFFVLSCPMPVDWAEGPKWYDYTAGEHSVLRTSECVSLGGVSCR